MIRYALSLILLAGLAGCGGDSPAPQEDNSKPAANPAPSPTQATAAEQGRQEPSPTPRVPPVKPLSLGALSGGDSSAGGGKAQASTGEDTLSSVLEAMQPLQVFLGQWNTTTRNMGAGSAKWVWDFRTDKSQPALVMSSEDHPYFPSARLTFLTDKQKFQITAQDKQGQRRTYRGEFTEQPHFITGEGGKPEPRFEMMLTEVGNDEARKLVGISLSQREKNRLLMGVFRRVGRRVQLQDTVANQRAGTSFALSDTSYGEKECIVSQGLGTMTVSYMGRTYYVCCSGCQAAFTDDPTFWIDKAKTRRRKDK